MLLAVGSVVGFLRQYRGEKAELEAWRNGRTHTQLLTDLYRLEDECERLRDDVLDREAQLAKRDVREKAS